MVAAVDTMMYAGQLPWHGLGTYVGEEDVLSFEALHLSGLDWEVEKMPLFTHFDDLQEIAEVPTHRVVVRSDNSAQLGVVGKNYSCLQNKEGFEFLDALVSEGAMKYHTAGSLRGGKAVWMLGKIGSTEVVPGDQVDQFILGHNCHDGSGSFRVLPTTVRVVCANTAALAIRKGKGQGVAIRHTRNMKLRVADAQKVLGLAVEAHAANEDYLKLLATIQLTKVKVNEIINALIPLPDEGNPTKALNQQSQLVNLFENGVGQDIPGVAGTGWAFHNAVTEYTNYHRISRGGHRFESAMFGSGSKFVEKANQLLVTVGA